MAASPTYNKAITGQCANPDPAEYHEHLMFTPLVQSSFNAGICSYDQPTTCVGSGQAWVKTGGKGLQLIHQHGAIKDTIDTDLDFEDVVRSVQGELLISDATNTCITSISPDKVVSTLFRTQWKPYGLCCLQSGDIGVTFFDEGRAVIYSRSGKVVQDLDTKLFNYPYKVAQNKINKDFCICDKSSTYSLSLGKITAVDTSNRFKYEYTGQGNTNFYPMDLCTDSAGRVLITDIPNRVHILDQDGQFLQYLLTAEQGLSLPVSIDVDNGGNAWVVQYDGHVKVVKYI